jgi:rare lipoprotein A
MVRLRAPLVLLLAVVLIYDGYCLAERGASGSLTFVQTGIASWYGREEQGRPTADGETFDRHEMTAASRKLPFNTIVRVTNENNNRSVQVRINDRGPWVNGRVLDLSEAAADTLDMKSSGTAPVKIQIVEPAPVSIVPSP